MEEYQKRVVEEQKALDEKANALYAFLASSQFEKIDEKQQSLLKTQYYAMKVYSDILAQRIALF